MEKEKVRCFTCASEKIYMLAITLLKYLMIFIFLTNNFIYLFIPMVNH